MKKTILLLTIVAITVFAFNVIAQKTSDKPVTSTIQNFDANSMPYRLQSDNRGAYLNGTDSVVSRIQGIGDWELDMLTSPTRKVYVDFADPVPNTNPNNLAAPLSNYYQLRFLTQCSPSLQNLALNATQKCPLIVAVNVGADRYSIRFYEANFPGTENPTWICTSASNGKCNGWRMQSLAADNSGKLRAQLLKVTTSKGKTVNQDYGKYFFSFDISLTNP